MDGTATKFHAFQRGDSRGTTNSSPPVATIQRQQHVGRGRRSCWIVQYTAVIFSIVSVYRLHSYTRPYKHNSDSPISDDQAYKLLKAKPHFASIWPPPVRKQVCYRVVSSQPMTVQYPTDFSSELKVPFYVYDDADLNWGSMPACGVHIGRTEYPLTKHSDDYWMLQSALNHPMRTTDPNQAKLFFVPLLLNAVADTYCYLDRYYCIRNNTICSNSTSFRELFYYADQTLRESTYFQRSQGKDHVLVLSHYAGQQKSRYFTALENLLRCNRVTFEAAPQREIGGRTLPDRIEIPGLYVTNNGGCKQRHDDDNKETDFAMIAAIKQRPNFQSRANICNWMQQYNYSYEVCGSGPMCPTLANAKFGFHPRGDTFGSNRLVDTIISGTVPLFTEEEQYNILPDFIPFREMGYLINASNKESFVAGMERLLNLSDVEYSEKLVLVHKYRDRSNFMSGESFDAYMATFARKLGLQK